MKVVFDTNIVASASFWRGKPFDCLAQWAQGKITVYVSPQLLSEYFDTVEELSACYPEKRRVEWIEALTASADLIFPADRARGETPDPFDEMVLECALAAEADYLVSGDKSTCSHCTSFVE
ncbi:MAG: putative toxin-antitoxin system toxin component, PIN family [Verrucomicrobiota bacterium]